MSKPFRLALIMDPVLGWRTNYNNWRDNFPQDLNVQPTWIVVSENESPWIDTPGISTRIRSRLRYFLALRRGLAQGPFDATLIQATSALINLSRYVKHNPCFFYIDSTPKQLFDFGDRHGWPQDKNPYVKQWKHQKRAASFRQARGIFSMSQWAIDSAVADYGARPENMHVLPPGVDLTRWHPADPAQKAGKEVCDLLFVGGDFDRKGGPLLLDWAARTQATGWRLHLVSPQTVQTQDPRVCVYNDLTSNDPRLQALYAQADVFVLPTLADCYSIAGVEALASGLPVVLGETGGTGEVVGPETGFLIPPNDAGALAASLKMLIGDPLLRARMGAAGRADAVERFDAAKLVREAVQIMVEKS